MTPFALLDDHAGVSRLFEGHRGTLRCDDAAGLPALLQELSAANTHAVALFSYELGAQMQGIAARDEGAPWAEILLFESCTLLDAAQTDAWLDAAQTDAWLMQHEDGAPCGIAGIRASVDEVQFTQAIARIRDYIAAGDTYQVNYTLRLFFDAFGSLHGLYRRLRARQMVPYGALVARPDGSAVLSRSPELFIRHQAGRLTARPMKGTAAATGDSAKDDAAAQALAQDPKNRAENLMIVDLLRNDLGRIAATGTVQVPALFEVQRFADVLQMTSTITADLRGDARLGDVFAALFPCGSITGAPKRRTMEIIRELEPDARGLYTGAIGWFSPAPAGKVPDFCLSVPIRTLSLGREENGLRRGVMGVGAGIVHDSVAADEYAECSLKARFLTGLSNDFELFETMRATHEEGVALLELHLQRLSSSAQYFGIPFDEADARRQVAAWCAALPPNLPHRLRLALRGGVISLQGGVLAPLATPVRIQLSDEAQCSGDLFLRHKSSRRERYDAAWRAAESTGAFDRIFTNETGELTEGGRSSLFIKLDGRWFTPPLAAGILPGVMRAVLCADPALAASERRLLPQDLQRAQAILVCNALRGALPAVLDSPGD